MTYRGKNKGLGIPGLLVGGALPAAGKAVSSGLESVRQGLRDMERGRIQRERKTGPKKGSAGGAAKRGSDAMMRTILLNRGKKMGGKTKYRSKGR